MNLGVDHSINSPGLCLDGKHFAFVNGKHDFTMELPNGGSITGFPMINSGYPEKATHVAVTFARWIATVTKDYADDQRVPEIVGFEDYAFSKLGGGQNRMLQIAESTGVMKSAMTALGFKLERYMPNTLKAQAGHGHAKKPDMAEFFKEEQGFYMHDIIGGKIGESPSADVVDAYYAWKCATNPALLPAGSKPKPKPRRKSKNDDTNRVQKET